MADLKYIMQGFQEDINFFDEIKEVLEKDDFTSVWILTAFINEHAIYNLIVMSDICNELEKITKGFVVANVREYDGKIESYDTMGAMAALAASLQTSMRIDIQDKLGVIEETSFKYEMYLTANQIENYKYRVMFVGYGIAGYPVKVVLEQDIADELNNKEDSGYIYTIDSKTEFEELLVSVFNSKTMQKIIQNLITASNRKLLEQKEAQEDC